MQTLLQLTKPNLSDSAAAVVREMIIDGRLRPGMHINEVHLAKVLGISRTPLREALMKLVAEGAITSRPRIGFIACPLTLEEFEQIYPIRSILDSQALRISGLPSPKQITRLRTINLKIGKTNNAAEASALDDAWHLELLAHCPNKVLIGLVEQFMLRTRRYEIALLRGEHSVTRILEEHQTIIGALIDGNLDAACAALKTNMDSGTKPIITWLRERQMRK